MSGEDDYRARLIAAREKLGLSQREMAERLLTPRNTYRQWEAGTRRTPGAAIVAAELLPSIRKKTRRPTAISVKILALADGTRDAATIAQAVYGVNDKRSRACVRNMVRALRLRGFDCSFQAIRAPKGAVAAPGTLSHQIATIATGDLTVGEIAMRVLGSANIRDRSRVQSLIREMKARGLIVPVRRDKKGPQTPESRKHMEELARMRATKRWAELGDKEAKAHMAMMRAAKLRASKCSERNEAICLLRKAGMTLQAIADEYGITRERVRQITSRAASNQ